MVRPGDTFCVLIAAVIAVALAGCTAPPTGDPVAEITPSAESTSTPEPQASPAQGDPQSTLPLACVDLLSAGQASAILQADVTLKVDESTIYRSWQIGAQQVGLLSCYWGGTNKTDNSWDQTIQLDILPEADADWQVGVWQVDDGAVVYPDGSTTSEYLCSAVDDSISTCEANLLVGGYWAHVHTQSIGLSDGRTDASAAASMRSLLDTLAPEIAGAGAARPHWQAPAAALQGNYCPSEAADAAASRYPSLVAQQRADYVSCSSPDGWRVAVQPGGSWAIPHLVGHDLSYAMKNAQAISLPGTDGGVWACGDGCMGIYSVNGSAISISADVMDEPTFTAHAAEILAAVVAAG